MRTGNIVGSKYFSMIALMKIVVFSDNFSFEYILTLLEELKITYNDRKQADWHETNELRTFFSSKKTNTHQQNVLFY